VRELKAAGDTDGAKALARRKKPTRAAHAVNQLAREHRDDLTAYLGLADALRAAQVAAARDDAARDALRALDRDRREQLAALLAHVEEDRDEGDRALASALVDPVVATAVRTGTLERIPAAPSGFDAFAADLGTAPAPPRERAADQRRREALDALDEQLDAARADVDTAEAAVRAARAEVDRAERQAAAAARALERLQAQRDRVDR
jgi:hypothetical protein